MYAWVNRETQKTDRQDFIKAIGPGWYCDIKMGEFESPHLLPNPEEYWPSVTSPTHPIVINWLIAGNCSMSCRYCYASDIMLENKREPNENNIEIIAKNILSFRPLVVVLTGGDPLNSPNLVTAINLLHSKVGIIIDTSGHLLTKEHIKLFKKYNITIRISLDSEQPKYHERYRPLLRSGKHQKYSTSLDSALSAICRCVDAKIPITVQSVATRYNANDLPALGDKLYRLGVHAWRIFKIVPSRCNRLGYEELVGTKRQQENMYSHIFRELLRLSKNSWKYKMSLQLTGDHALNAVFLVSPVGIYYTESNVSNNKIIIDENSPKKPKISSIHKVVNMQAHSERYLNLTTKYAIK